jgi:hypothetical protein
LSFECKGEKRLAGTWYSSGKIFGLETEEKEAEMISDDIFFLYDFIFILWIKGRRGKESGVV